MADSTAGRRRNLRRMVQESDDHDIDVICRALTTFIADAEQWSAPPHEDIGRAHVLLVRLGEGR